MRLHCISAFCMPCLLVDRNSHGTFWAPRASSAWEKSKQLHIWITLQSVPKSPSRQVVAFGDSPRSRSCKTLDLNDRLFCETRRSPSSYSPPPLVESANQTQNRQLFVMLFEEPNRLVMWGLHTTVRWKSDGAICEHKNQSKNHITLTNYTWETYLHFKMYI